MTIIIIIITVVVVVVVVIIIIIIIINIIIIMIVCAVSVGAYDHTAKLFDARTQSSVMTVEHGYPVESVLLFPTDGIFLTAGTFWPSVKGMGWGGGGGGC